MFKMSKQAYENMYSNTITITQEEYNFFCSRIADLENQVAELTEERERGRKIAGAYHVVPKETLDAKDARIAELRKELDSVVDTLFPERHVAYKVVKSEELDAKDARIAELEAAARTPACDHTSDMLRIGQYQHQIAALKAENAEFKARRNASKKHRDKENRLSCEDDKYDKCGVGGISVDAANKAALLAEQMLKSGNSLSYAAACLLVLHQKLKAFHPYSGFLENLSDDEHVCLTITRTVSSHLID
jgi:uncharacterized small protein (DUF1192 family)